MALQQLFERVPDVRVALRLKILAQISTEVLDSNIPHVHEATAVDNTVRRELTYGEWLEDQCRSAPANRLAARSVYSELSSKSMISIPSR